jgi:DNA (cytosine-5)-methyltransferase 1
MADTITYASVCDGIGAAHVAWQPLGWKCAWTSEIEPFPIAVVYHHWHFPNLGDMTAIDAEKALRDYGPLDVLVAGCP